MISFVMVNYNSKDTTKHAIESLINACGSRAYEIIIIDNQSQDGSFEMFSELAKTEAHVKYFYLDTNYGFGHACNEGAARAQGDILVFINPDTEVDLKTNPNVNIVEFFNKYLQTTSQLERDDHSKNEKNVVRVLAPKIIYPDGSDQPNGGGAVKLETFIYSLFGVGYFLRKYKIIILLSKIVPVLDEVYPRFKNTVVGKYLLNFSQNQNDNSLIKEFDWVSGACLGVRKKDFDLVGGFDTRFFMYCEDVDLCKRLKDKLGGKILLSSEFILIHSEGISQKVSSFLTRGKKERYFSNIKYLLKYSNLNEAETLRYLYVISMFMSGVWLGLIKGMNHLPDRFQFGLELINLDLKAADQEFKGQK